MGTNYRRIPKVSDMVKRKQTLNNRLEFHMNLFDANQASNEFNIIDMESGWETQSPWDEFTDDMSVHLGKRSGGWKFCWNFHNNKYYSSKEGLIQFVLSGRVVNEYGEEIDSQEFLDMAFSWGEHDGLVADKEYFDSNNHHSWMSNPEDYYDKEVDGLRVSSSTEFS